MKNIVAEYIMNLTKGLALQMAAIPVFGPALINYHLRRRYGPRVVTPLKTRNFIQVRRDISRKAIEVKSLPYILNLDTLNGCNLACPFCPTGTGQLDRDRTRLPLAKAKSVIKAVKSHVLEARLFNWGEPFLNPDIFKLINYTSESDIYTVINSNLSVKVKDLGEKIVDCGLDLLSVSMDGLEQGTLEKYRRGANRDLVLDNIRSIVEARRKKGHMKPRIEIAFFVFRHNEHELARLKDMRKELGVDSFFPRRASIYHESFVPENPDFQSMQEIFKDTCMFLYSELTVESVGTVSPCCANMSKKWDIGPMDNLKDLKSFWNSPPYKAMRAYFAGADLGRAKSINRGKEILCQYCGFVARKKQEHRKLSPVPPSLAADGDTFHLAGS